MSVSKYFGRMAAAVSVAVVLGVGMMLGCGGEGDDDFGGLVLPSGQAWTDGHEYEAGNRDGIVFQSDGTVWFLNDYGGSWRVDGRSSYTVGGNKLTMFGDTGTFRISTNGDTLELEDPYGDISTYTKTTGVNFTLPPPPTGGNLVLPDGEAWTDGHEYEAGNREGVIFQGNGTALTINDYDGYWEVDDEFSYTVNGNKMVIYGDIIEFGVSSNGNTLFLYHSYGEITTLTRTTDVNLIAAFSPSAAFKAKDKPAMFFKKKIKDKGKNKR